MTRYEKIMKEMTVEKMAETRVTWDYRQELGDIYVESIYFVDGHELPYHDYEDAIQAEIEWLNGVDA